jgi:hypothetical protein
MNHRKQNHHGTEPKGGNVPAGDVNVVLAHGAWADGSSWGKVIGPLKAPA